MNELHIILQSKGGVGKSFVGFILSQYLRSKDNNTVIYDTDPNNHTLVNFTDLNCQTFDLTDPNDRFKVSVGNFDNLFEDIYQNCAKYVVIDTGSNTYKTIVKYLSDSDCAFVDFLSSTFDYNIIFHMPISNGAACNDCITSILECSQLLPNVKIIPWINNYPEPVFNTSNIDKIKKENVNPVTLLIPNSEKYSNIVSCVNTPIFEASTFMKNLRTILDVGLTFNAFDNLFKSKQQEIKNNGGDERIKSVEYKRVAFDLISRCRIDKIRNVYFSLLDHALSNLE